MLMSRQRPAPAPADDGRLAQLETALAERDAYIATLVQEKADLEAELAKYREVHAKVVDVCDRAAHGDLEARIIGIGHFGELAILPRSINRLLDLSDAFIREATASLRSASEGRYYRRFLPQGMRGAFGQGAEAINRTREAMQRMANEAASRRAALADAFEKAVAHIVDAVAGAAARLERTSHEMATLASEAAVQTQTAAAAAEELSANAATVAEATCGLASEIHVVGRHVTEAGNVASAAVVRAGDAERSINELAQIAQDIGGIMTVIERIAAETKMLALNATIEAARAGAAGKGFAVVANEVKALAAQTSEATDRTSRQITEIQRRTMASVETIKAIAEVVRNVNRIAEQVGDSVGEQSRATDEIDRSIAEAAAASRQVSGTVHEVCRATGATGEAADGVRAAAGDLAAQAERLRQEVARFLSEVRAA
jgi:methyl-accepting chemotaxis protein